MKPRIFSAARLSFPLATAIAALLAVQPASAATLYWDNNAATAGFSTASGTWAQNSTTTGRWTTSNTGELSGSLTQATSNTDVFNFGTSLVGLNAGTITVSGGVTMGNTFFGAASGAIVLTGSTITYAAAPTITVNNASNTINSVVAGAATSLTKAGSGILILGGANTYAGTTIISNGRLQIGNGGTTGRLTATTGITNNANLTINRSNAFSQATDLGAGVAITGAGSFIQAGAGTTTLSASNSYSGATIVSNGTLKFGASNVIGDSSAVTIGGAAAAGTLDIGGFSDTFGATLTLGNSGTTVGSLQSQIVNTGGGSPALTVAAGITYNAGAVGFNNGKALISADINLSAANRAWNVNDSTATTVDLEVSGVVTNGGISKQGTGTLYLNNTANTFALQFLADAGKVQVTKLDVIGNNSSLGTGASSSAIRLGNDATATLEYVGTTAGSTDRSIQIGTNTAGNTGSASILNNGAGELVFTATNFNTTIAGVTAARTLTLGGSYTGATNEIQGKIQDVNTAGGGTVSVVKQDAGVWKLTGASTYKGATSVNAGALAVNGSLANTTTTVGNGGTLQGSGSIGGSVTVQGGGTIAAGNSIESLTTGSLTLQAESIFAYEINNDAAAGVAGDLTAVTGDLTLDLGNAALLTLGELGVGSWSIGEKLTLISYSGTWNGGLFSYGSTLADDSTITFSGMGWSFNYNDTSAGTNYTSDLTGSSYVTMTAIPEPNVAALLGGLGILSLLGRRRNG
jgi:autotransporter-associated beta strand protein